MARTRRDPEKSKELIVEAAVRVIAELGPARAGLKEVAKEAGISHGLITHYFGSFNNLVETAMKGQWQGLRDRLLAAIAARPDLDAEGLIRELYGEMKRPESARLLAWSLMSGQMAEPEFFARKYKGLKVLVDAVVASTGAKRELVEELFVIVWSTMASYCVASEILWTSLSYPECSAELDERIVDRLCIIATDALRK